MSKAATISLLALRFTVGWMFFYAGFIKIANAQWSAEGFLKGAKTFTPFYHFLLDPSLLPIVNFLNEWGLFLIGISLILGIGMRISAVAGMVLMVLYYLPILQFPYPNPNSFIVDQHIIYFFTLWYLWSVRAEIPLTLASQFHTLEDVRVRRVLNVLD